MDENTHTYIPYIYICVRKGIILSPPIIWLLDTGEKSILSFPNYNDSMYERVHACMYVYG